MIEWTTPEQIENDVLPCLLDQYENGNKHATNFLSGGSLTVEEKPVFDSWVGTALANGWIKQFVVTGIAVPEWYQLTASGYLYFKPRMNFRRAFQG